MKIDSLRPKKLEDYIGQENNKENIKIYIDSAKIRNAPLSHVLLHGGAGLGKTTLATVIANEFNRKIYYANAANVEKMSDLMGYFVNLEDGDFLFIDEIHRLDKKIEENLYTAMEDFRVDIKTQKGNEVKPISITLNKFTLIGATTMKGKLSTPFIERFGININLLPYTEAELCQIIKNNSKKLNLNLDEDSLMEIAKRSRSTPRRANHILNRVLDFATVLGISDVKKEFVVDILEKLKIDSLGLEDIDRKILKSIAFNNSETIGINALSSLSGESRETIENDIEPYLLQNGFIERTQRGRKITKKGIEVIKDL